MKRLLAHASTLVLAAFASGAAFAQSSDPTSLDDIIVTANKRAENVQDVPLSVAVVLGEQLETRGVRELTDVAKISPSIAFNLGDHPTNNFIRIRGIGSLAFSVAAEASTAIQIDDVPVLIQGRAYTDLLDVSRIEVLRGPQSTLYGKSASSGLINIYTEDPTSDFSARINALATTDREYRFGFSASGPISDTLGYRLTASRSEFGGLQRNQATGDRVGGSEDTIARGKLVWQPNDRLRVTGILNYNESDALCCATTLLELAPGALFRNVAGLTIDVAMPGVTPGPMNRDINFDRTNYVISDEFGQALKIEYDLPGDFSFISVTSHDYYEYLDGIDNDGGNAPQPQFVATRNFQSGGLSSRGVTQEFRLVSPGDRPLRYVAGLFYSNTDNERFLLRGPAFAQQEWYAEAGNTNIAAFGQADLDFLENWTATAGVRFQKEELDYVFNDVLLTRLIYTGQTEDQYSTYRLGLRYQFTDDVMMFGSFATGHKGQAYDLTSGFNAQRQALGPVQPETSESYEIGIKSQMFDRRLTVNATAFAVDYVNLQQQTTEFVPDATGNLTQVFRLGNVGAVSTTGLELEAAWRVTPDLNVTSALTYLDAVTESYVGAQCFPLQTVAQGCVTGLIDPATGRPITAARQDLSGRKLPVPEISFNLGYDYSRPIGTSGLEFTTTGFYQWQDGFQSGNGDPEVSQESFGILNLTAGIRSPGQYELVAFINNVFDENYITQVGNVRGNWGNLGATGQALSFQQQRDFLRYGGVRLTLSF